MLSVIRSFSQSTPLSSLHLHASLIAILLALASYRLLIRDWSDPYHCNALLHSGRWLDGAHHKNWQPDGCILHPYKPKALIECLSGRSVIFIGDSVTRVLFYGTLRTLDPSISPDGQAKHSDRLIDAGGIEWRFVWDPFLNGTVWTDLLSRKLQSSLPSRTTSSLPLHPPSSTRPALVVVGSGLWYLRQQLGLGPWKATIDKLFDAAHVRPGRPPIADELVLLPVELPAIEKLSPIRKQTISPADVAAMNVYGTQKLAASPGAQIAIPTVMNLMAASAASETRDGLHYSNRIADIQARIVLNLRCNDQLPKKFPLDKTCCSQYPRPTWVQTVLLLILLLWAPIGLYLARHPNSALAGYTPLFPARDHLAPLATFGAAVILLFLSDRTTLFNKEQKQFDSLQFGLLNLLALAAGLLTARTSDKGDLGLLNREQTDEWKGWMQIAILIYHYLAGSQVSGIYNPIRVCVAGYLFMSGYGHFTFYYCKKNYGFARILSVLVRLNLLTVALAYVMDTDYLSYYFSPLVSMWFLIIWGTMWVGHQWNDRLGFMLAKLACSAGLCAGFFKADWPLRGLFGLTNSLCGTEWYPGEWAFRVRLDMYIVYWGMLAALGYLKTKELKLMERHSARFEQFQRAAVWASLAGLGWFFWFELTRPNKLVYNHYHPFISVIPIGSFVVLRNASGFLRSTNSRFFVYFGQCSLETFIVQFHFWLAADTKGILKVLPWPGHRVVNFIVSSIVFVFVSNELATATGQLTSWLCHKPSRPPTGTSGGTYAAVAAEEGQGRCMVEMEVGEEKEEEGTQSERARERWWKAVKVGKLYEDLLWVRAMVWIGGIWTINLLAPGRSSG